jgi:hypothetical protein
MTTATQFATPVWGCARSLGLAALVVFGSISMAKADTVFNFNGTVGDILGTSTPSAYGYTGLTVTGTLNIDTVGGTIDNVDITVQGDSNQFVNLLSCSTNCTYIVDNGFNEYGLLDTGSLVSYTGGPIGSDSWIYLDNANGSFGGLGLGQGGSGIAYSLSGTITPSTATPEPRYYTALLGLVLIGSVVAVRRRQQA